MLYIIGLGLSCAEDITVYGLKIVHKCTHIFLDAYTCMLTHGIDKLEAICKKPIKLAYREFVESEDSLINLAKEFDVAFLVVGDPLGATTHTDLVMRAIKEDISFKVIHNASIITGVGCCGLFLYRYGETVSIPMWDEFGEIESFYEKIMCNFTRQLHTLCLLDIKVKEKSLKNLLSGRDIYEPPRYLNCMQAAYQILETANRHEQRYSDTNQLGDDSVYRRSQLFLSPECVAVCLARVGSPDQSVVVSTLGILARTHRKLDDSDKNLENPLVSALGEPLHTLVIPGELHHMEEEMLMARFISPSRGDNRLGTKLPLIFPTILHSQNHFDDLKSLTISMFKRHNELVKETKMLG